jgi:hypothetical protein
MNCDAFAMFSLDEAGKDNFSHRFSFDFQDLDLKE